MSSLYNDNFLDTLSILSFIIGVMNYDENLSQSDKDDMLNKISVQMQALLEHLEKDIDEQNEMLREILQLLKED